MSAGTRRPKRELCPKNGSDLRGNGYCKGSLNFRGWGLGFLGLGLRGGFGVYAKNGLHLNPKPRRDPQPLHLKPEAVEGSKGSGLP